MRIALNALSAQQGGGISVLINLLPHLAQVDRKNTYIIFYAPYQQGIVSAIPERFKKVAITYLPRNPFVRVLWEQLIFPFYLIWHRIDVLYSVGNTTSIFAPCKIILLIENAIPYSRIGIQWSVKERFRNKLLRVLGWFSAHRATKVRFVSENSKNFIVPQLGVSPEKCVVIPHGVSQKPPLPLGEGRVRAKSYILTIGANGPHRNTARLLQAFSVLITRYGYEGDLIVVGNTGSPRWRNALDKLVQKLGLGSRVVFKGEIPHREVSSYFKGAEAFVFPSVEETFGIPLIEAMKCGVPIAASDCDLDSAHRGKCFNPFREICGDAAAYFNPFDAKDIVQCVHRVLTDGAFREKLVARGKKRVKKYNLEDTARALVQLFEGIYNS